MPPGHIVYATGNTTDDEDYKKILRCGRMRESGLDYASGIVHVYNDK